MIAKITKFRILLLATVCLSCSQQNLRQTSVQSHVIYLHGQIVENYGRHPFSEQYGFYELDSILSSLEQSHTKVYCSIRPASTVPEDYALIVSNQIDSLLSEGVPPNSITVVGASKGAIIASFVSSRRDTPINYVLLAGNNDFQEANNDWVFHGQVLTIFDPSDQIAGKNYNYWQQRSEATKFKQVELMLGLGHGFIYRPLPDWIEPTNQWISEQKAF